MRVSTIHIYLLLCIASLSFGQMMCSFTKTEIMNGTVTISSGLFGESNAIGSFDSTYHVFRSQCDKHIISSYIEVDPWTYGPVSFNWVGKGYIHFTFVDMKSYTGGIMLNMPLPYQTLLNTFSWMDGSEDCRPDVSSWWTDAAGQYGNLQYIISKQTGTGIGCPTTNTVLMQTRPYIINLPQHIQ